MEDKEDKEFRTRQKINKYHSEEIKLILFICASDLSDYSYEDLTGFAECIEGRIDVLFEPEYLQLQQRAGFLKMDESTISKFKTLQEFLVSIYASRWSRIMKDKQTWEKANILAVQILKELNIDYIEPNMYMEDENNLNLH